MGLDGTEMGGQGGREAGLHALGVNQRVSWGKGALVQAEVSPGLGNPAGTSEPCSCQLAALSPGLFGWLREPGRVDVFPDPEEKLGELSTARLPGRAAKRTEVGEVVQPPRKQQ